VNDSRLAVARLLLALQILVVLLGATLLVVGAARATFAQDAPPSAVAAPGAAFPAAPEPSNLKDHLAERRLADTTTFFDRLVSVFGFIVLLGLGWALSVDRRRIPWRLVVFGVLLQVVFALLILKTAPGQWVFSRMTDAVNVLLGFTAEGARFLFGDLVYNNIPVGRPLGDTQMGPIPSGETFAHAGAFVAFNVLPTIIFFSSFMTVLYHLGVMTRVVRGAAWIMQRTMKTSGAETLSAAANIFVGMTEAPLVVRPFVAKMTESELMAVMTGGFATIAGGVMAAYVGMLRHLFPDIAGHLIAASVMSAPAGLVVAKLMVPERDAPETAGTMPIAVEKLDINVIDAAARGASDGLKLALNVGAMLLAFIALIAMLNWVVGALGGLVGLEGLTFQQILGYVFAPVAWAMGVPASECLLAGQILGEKTVLNEFVAYLHLADLLGQGQALSYRSTVILIYALCGFANFGSIAIQLGGIGGIAPSRRQDLARLGLKAMIAGTIACFMTAAIAGFLL